MPHGFLPSLPQVLEYGLKTNSYKLVLARALADDDLPRDPVIPAPWLADKFLELYWPLRSSVYVSPPIPLVSRLPYKAAVQLASDLNLRPGRTLGSARTSQPEKVRRLVDRLATKGGCLDEVVPAIQPGQTSPSSPSAFSPSR